MLCRANSSERNSFSANCPIASRRICFHPIRKLTEAGPGLVNTSCPGKPDMRGAKAHTLASGVVSRSSRSQTLSPSFSGRRKTLKPCDTCRAELLQQVKDQRSQRAAEALTLAQDKRREAAALHIQSFFRQAASTSLQPPITFLITTLQSSCFETPGWE